MSLFLYFLSLSDFPVSCDALHLPHASHLSSVISFSLQAPRASVLLLCFRCFFSAPFCFFLFSLSLFGMIWVWIFQLSCQSPDNCTISLLFLLNTCLVCFSAQPQAVNLQYNAIWVSDWTVPVPNCSSVTRSAKTIQPPITSHNSFLSNTLKPTKSFDSVLPHSSF